MDLITTETLNSVLMSPASAAVAYAFYMQAVHIYSELVGNRFCRSGKISHEEFGRAVFMILMAAGSITVLSRYVIFEDCSSPPMDTLFSVSKICGPGGFQLGETLINISQYMPIAFGISGGCFLVRFFFSLLPKRSARIWLVVAAGVCFGLAGIFVLYYSVMHGVPCCMTHANGY